MNGACVALLLCVREAQLRTQGSNYDTDIWDPIFEAIRVATGAEPYGGQACLLTHQAAMSQACLFHDFK